MSRSSPTARGNSSTSTARSSSRPRSSRTRWRAGRPFAGHWYRLPPVEPPADAVEAEERNPDSILAFYRRAIAYRNSSQALRRGAFTERVIEDRLWIYEREVGDERLVVAVNMGPEKVTVDEGAFSAASSPRIAVGTSLDREGEKVDGPVVLGPREAVIIELGEKLGVSS